MSLQSRSRHLDELALLIPSQHTNGSLKNPLPQFTIVAKIVGLNIFHAEISLIFKERLAFGASNPIDILKVPAELNVNKIFNKKRRVNSLGCQCSVDFSVLEFVALI